MALAWGAPKTRLSSGTYTHKSRRIRPRAFRHYMAGGQITVHPGHGISDIPHHGKSCTNAGGLRLPVSRPVPVVYRAIAPASENCMRSYRLSGMHCLTSENCYVIPAHIGPLCVAASGLLPAPEMMLFNPFSVRGSIRQSTQAFMSINSQTPLRTTTYRHALRTR
jgi:hypothetical protein